MLQAGADVSAFLSAWGAWQPALDPFRSPSVADALIGSLGGHGSERRVSLSCSGMQRPHGCILKTCSSLNMVALGVWSPLNRAGTSEGPLQALSRSFV